MANASDFVPWFDISKVGEDRRGHTHAPRGLRAFFLLAEKTCEICTGGRTTAPRRYSNVVGST